MYPRTPTLVQMTTSPHLHIQRLPMPYSSSQVISPPHLSCQPVVRFNSLDPRPSKRNSQTQNLDSSLVRSAVSLLRSRLARQQQLHQLVPVPTEVVFEVGVRVEVLGLGMALQVP